MILDQTRLAAVTAAVLTQISNSFREDEDDLLLDCPLGSTRIYAVMLNQDGSFNVDLDDDDCVADEGLSFFSTADAAKAVIAAHIAEKIVEAEQVLAAAAESGLETAPAEIDPIHRLRSLAEGMTAQERYHLAHAEYIKLRQMVRDLTPEGLANIQAAFTAPDYLTAPAETRRSCDGLSLGAFLPETVAAYDVVLRKIDEAGLREHYGFPAKI